MDKKIKSLSVFRKNVLPKSPSTDDHEGEFLVSESHYEPVYGRLVSETQFGADGIPEQIMKLEYNQNGFLTGEELFDSDGTTLEKKTWEPDAKGRIFREYVHYADGSADRIDYAYDEKGRIFKKERFDEDGELESAEHFEYENDHLIRETVLNAEGETSSETLYTYDENANLTEVMSDNPEEEIWFRKVYRYDEAGHRLSVTTFNREGDPVQRVSFENDEKGRPTQIIEENRRQKNTVQMEYDERGEILFQEEKDLNGEVTNRIERIFDQEGLLAESYILVRNFQRGISRNYTLRNKYTFFD